MQTKPGATKGIASIPRQANKLLELFITFPWVIPDYPTWWYGWYIWSAAKSLSCRMKKLSCSNRAKSSGCRPRKAEKHDLITGEIQFSLAEPRLIQSFIHWFIISFPFPNRLSSAYRLMMLTRRWPLNPTSIPSDLEHNSRNSSWCYVSNLPDSKLNRGVVCKCSSHPKIVAMIWECELMIWPRPVENNSSLVLNLWSYRDSESAFLRLCHRHDSGSSCSLVNLTAQPARSQLPELEKRD